MVNLNRANEVLEQPKDMRILYLAPMTVASCHMCRPSGRSLIPFNAKKI